ncbi:MAG: hypothetical protein R3A78_02775 [Polyangiales bacterium]
MERLQDRPMRAWLGAGLALAMATCGCGKSADSHYAGWDVFEPEDGSFLVRYRNPPWHLVSKAGDRAVLEIKRQGSGFVDIDAGDVLSAGRFDTKYYFTTRIVSASPSDCVTDMLALMPEGATIKAASADFETSSGVLGRDATYRYYVDGPEMTAPRYTRVVCLTHPNGSLELVVDSIPDPLEREMTEMLRGVEVKAP